MSSPAFVPARPEDQQFVPPRPEDQGFVAARPEDHAAVSQATETPDAPAPPAPPTTTAQHIQADLAAGRNPVVEAAKRDWDKVKGAVKGVARTGAGALDIANTPFLPAAAAGDKTVLVPGIKHLTDAVRARTQVNNPEQETGDFVESMLEFLPMMEEEGPGIAKNLVEKFGVAQDLAKIAQKYPKLASAWNVMMAGTKAATRAGAEQGGQTFVKTGGDVEATKEATRTGAEWGGVLGAGAEAAGETAAAIRSRRVASRTVAGASFETHPKTGKQVLRNLEDVSQDPATQAVDEAMGNIGKTGVANSLNRSATERAPEAKIIDKPNRQLPGRAGFEVGPAEEPTPTGEGQIGFDPRKRQTGTRVVEGKGPGQFNLEQYETGQEPPPTGEGDLTQRGSHREPTWQYLSERKPGSPPVAGDETAGPGVMILTDDGQAMSPERARQQVAQYDRILNDENEVGELGVRQHQDIVNARQSLSDQLYRYDNFAASQPHFAKPNVLEAVRNTNSLADASEHLKATHSPVWDAADKASGGEWTNLREREKWLRKKLASDNPIGNYDDLAGELKQNQADQMAFFEKYRTTLSPEEAHTAINGYQDGIVLGNLDDMLQRKFGGISRELEQRGMASGNKRQRVFQPEKNFNQQLEDFYNEGTNRDVLTRTIGQDHMDALHDLGIMFNSTERMQQAKGLTGTILSSILHHYHGVKGMLAAGGGAMMLAGTLGAREAGIAGVPLLTGTGAGIRRYITEKLITDPSFLKTFQYALENGIPSRTAGPLLAARIISSFQNQPLKRGKIPQENNRPSGLAKSAANSVTEAVKGATQPNE